MKLFAVYLGGRVPKSHIEQHDVVFVVGDAIEHTYPQLLALWFGSPEGLHLDSWLALDRVDGYRVELSKQPPAPDAPTLFFVNLGGYQPGRFIEVHDSVFLVARDRDEAKQRAKLLLAGALQQLHVDDSLEVDDCLAVEMAGGWHVRLSPTDEPCQLVPHNDYHRVPVEAIAKFKAELVAAC